MLLYIFWRNEVIFICNLTMEIIDIYHLYDIVPKIIIGVIILAFISFDVFSVVLINKTKRTSKSTRFLSSALIIFDSLSLAAILARLCVGNDYILARLGQVGFYTLLAGFVTICLMCVERLIIFSAPTKYILYFRYRSSKVCAVFVWSFVFCSLITFEFAFCGFRIKITPAFASCLTTTIKVASFISFVTNVMAGMCYVRIGYLIRKLSLPPVHLAAKGPCPNHNKAVLNLSNTKLVLMYLATLTATNICLITWYAIGRSNYDIRIFFDATSMIAAIIDPCLYVYWFKECKLEFFKIIARCLPRLKNRIEDMRMDIFNIHRVTPARNRVGEQ